MLLLKGVQVYFNYKISDHHVRNKIWLSNGINLAKFMDKSEGTYLESSISPKKPWHEATDAELKILITEKSASSRQNNIGLVKLPEKIITLISETGISKIKTHNEINTLYQQYPDQMKLVFEELTAFLNEFHCSGGSINPLGIFINPPGMLTTTKNEDNYYMGMHFDDSRYLDPDSLQHSLNRIAINLGSEPRILFFINKSLSEIFDMINKFEKVNYKQFTSKREVVSLFYKYYPEYPVTKISIDPFEAYIAPVSNIIHDASTEGRKTPDISMHILGSFSISNKQLTVGFNNTSKPI